MSDMDAGWATGILHSLLPMACDLFHSRTRWLQGLRPLSGCEVLRPAELLGPGRDLQKGEARVASAGLSHLSLSRQAGPGALVPPLQSPT